MNFGSRHYVPCLRWKQGEYKALRLLSSNARDVITPLIEVAEIGFDFETGTPAKTIDKHLAPFAKRVRENWGTQPCFVDPKHIAATPRMANGRHPVDFVFADLRQRGCVAVPVISLSSDAMFAQCVGRAMSADGRGACLRLEISEAAKPTLKRSIEALLNNLVAPNECDLIFDLGAPNFEPIAGFSKAVEALIQRVPHLNQWRTFTLMGTAFPQSMGEIKTSPAVVPRNEWLLYKLVAARLATLEVRVPAFGDYCINHPTLLPMDMRLLKPSGTLRYTTPTSWFLLKGPNVRDNRFDQYRGHCRAVIDSANYSGSEFSAGDQYIAECARGTSSTGNLTTWRWVGTNHHMEMVAHEVSSFDATSSGVSQGDGDPLN